MNIFFDCFGTLIDTGRSSITATEAMLSVVSESYNSEEFYKVWKKLSGHLVYERFQLEEDLFLESFNETRDLFGSKARAASVAPLVQEIENRVPFPDAVPIVIALSQHFKIYVASNSDEQPLNKCLEPFKNYLAGICSSERLECYKPNSEFYRKMLAVSGQSAVDSVYIGDSLINDYCKPKSLGIESYWLNRSKNQNSCGYSSLTDIAAAISDQYGYKLMINGVSTK